MAFTSKVNYAMFILAKTVIFICMGRNADRENVQTYRDKQGRTWTHRD